MDEGFKNRVVIVTGSAQGIGRNIAIKFAQAGAKVWVMDQDKECGQRTVEEIVQRGMLAEYAHVDLSQDGEGVRTVTAIGEAEGRIDVLVNNARAGERRNFETEDELNWDLAMGVMLKSPYFCARSALPYMSSGQASIVNISSVSGQLVSAESPGYQCAKAGLLHLTKYLAMTLGPKGVRVNSILPGFIVKDEHRKRYDDPGNAEFRARVEKVHPVGSEGEANDVAEAALFLASPKSKFITGVALTVDGGLTVPDQWTVASQF